jgi:hypothetical protein
MRIIAAFAAAVLVLSACADLTDLTDLFREGRTLPEPTAPPRTEQLDDSTWREWSTSAPVEEGVEYRMNVYTHCGLDYLLDFDRSFWDVEAAPHDPFEHLDDPFDEGLIRRVGRDTAVFVSSAGAEFRLARADRRRDVGPCE